jgi:hypothetical protein
VDQAEVGFGLRACDQDRGSLLQASFQGGLLISYPNQQSRPATSYGPEPEIGTTYCVKQVSLGFLIPWGIKAGELYGFDRSEMGKIFFCYFVGFFVR